MIFVSTIDNVYKPILLGLGVKVRMLVIFAGSIGGFIAFGDYRAVLGGGCAGTRLQVVSRLAGGESETGAAAGKQQACRGLIY